MKNKYCDYCNKNHKAKFWHKDEEGKVYCGKWRYYGKKEE